MRVKVAAVIPAPPLRMVSVLNREPMRVKGSLRHDYIRKAVVSVLNREPMRVKAPPRTPWLLVS